MFELSVAFKYLNPKWRQLSTSIISLISILVIALVVWLIIVFFSVTQGLEKSWIQKLIALTAPVRITPTENYNNSYYYQVDGLSLSSHYTHKSLGEKLKSIATDPYDPEMDGELPDNLPPKDMEPDGSLKDLAKKAYQIAATLPHIEGLKVRDYELATSNLRIKVDRVDDNGLPQQSFLSQAAYLGSFDPDNNSFSKALQPLTMDDLNNILAHHVKGKKTAAFFKSVKISKLSTPSEGWLLPKSLFSKAMTFEALFFYKDSKVVKVLLPIKKEKIKSLKKKLESQDMSIKQGEITLSALRIPVAKVDNEDLTLTTRMPIYLEGNKEISAQLIPESLKYAEKLSDVRFLADIKIQGQNVSGEISLNNLLIKQAAVESTPNSSPIWIYQIKNGEMILPENGILLPKSFKEAGVLVGDAGNLSYFAATTSAVQEQHLPVVVAGFYDPGIIPIGGKFVLANQEVVSLIRSSQNQEHAFISNGLNVRFNDLEQAEDVKEKIISGLEKAGLTPYWKVETYKEYEFTKDLIQQLHSERNLWTLLATVIIIVACSNIISMLIILVNDKKVEIGILRSMGASSVSIATIFGLCGLVMGAIGSIIGTIAAVITLANLQTLVDFIGKMQGYQMFNPVFYGNILPSEVSMEALLFVVIATSIISLIAGVIPAIKACLLRPSHILRSE